MKLARFRLDGSVRLGQVVDDVILDLTGAGLGAASMLALVEAGSAGLDSVGDAAAKARHLPLRNVQLLAPIERPGKYLAIGMNYQKHVEEAKRLGVDTPKHQVWFNKQTTCITGPYDRIDPGVTEKLDYEVELAVIIGCKVKGVSAAEALSCIFGYTVANDVSARDWQFHSPTFTMGKSFDTHGPIGPWIVTADEIPDPQSLRLECSVNGEVRQSSSTSSMLHRIDAQIAYLSMAFTLEPGDLIATGTPEGVGVGMDPPSFLRSGDVVRCEIERIGAIENRVYDGDRPPRNLG